ncbi:DUF6973 domain-containing protein [Massilia timonae]|uniref:DUF6973 domain-containing protein n=1 Tax=Massilia timonae TaxID=47229 RepID=A0A1S2N8J0_9BURK|nr:hypothetical protein [Massilia timonae]OIJ40934.1 hypothetical protein LO55_3835 [Massilia timonae]
MPASVLIKIWNLSRSEKVYLMMYPEHATLIDEAARTATDETKRLFGRHDHNGQGDAFRHCFWSAILCREIGYNNALRYTSAHEDFPENPPEEKAMDLHNNAVGLSIGRIPTSNQLLGQLCISALRSGRLKVLSQ